MVPATIACHMPDALLPSLFVNDTCMVWHAWVKWWAWQWISNDFSYLRTAIPVGAMHASISDKRIWMNSALESSVGFGFIWMEPGIPSGGEWGLVFKGSCLLTISSPFPPFLSSLYSSRSRTGLYCLPESCEHDATANFLGYSFFYYASFAWPG